MEVEWIGLEIYHFNQAYKNLIERYKKDGVKETIFADVPERSNGTGLGGEIGVFIFVKDTCWLSAFAGSNPAVRISFVI